MSLQKQDKILSKPFPQILEKLFKKSEIKTAGLNKFIINSSVENENELLSQIKNIIDNNLKIEELIFISKTNKFNVMVVVTPDQPQ